MATLAIGAIGAVIGNTIGGTFLGMSATSLGWNLGLTVGGMLFGPKGQDQQFEGPRLSDLKVQASTYGNPIPTVYGAARIAGNMIWSRPIDETAHVSTQSSGGGKGGGGGSTITTTTYTYSQSFAVALCEGEIAGVRKIWANGTLIYNLDADADIASLVASQQIAEGITVYPGSETQEPDPLIEADVGTANAPAFRGTAYVVFEDLQLADYGNRAPNLEFEVVASGDVSDIIYEPVDAAIPTDINYNRPGLIAYGNGAWILVRWNATQTGSATYRSTDGVNFSEVPAGYEFKHALRFLNGNFFLCGTGIKISANGVTWTDSTGIPSAQMVAYDNGFYWANYNNIVYHSVDGLSWSDASAPGATNKQFTCAGGGRVLVWKNTGGGGYYVYGSFGWREIANPFPSATVRFAYGNGIYAAAYAGGWYHSTDGENWTSGAANTIPVITDLLFANGLFFAVGVVLNGAGHISITKDCITASNKSTGVNNLYGAGFGRNGFMVTFPGADGGFDYANVWVEGITATSTDLDATVTAICERAGLAAADIDVTGLSGTIGGYVTQQSTARSQLEQLATAFYFDAVESDGKVKFIPRGGSSAASIDEDDLAAQLGDRSIADPLRISRQQELELPVEVTVQHFDSAAGYAIGSQRSQRLITDSLNKQSINLAISCDVDKAKQIAEVLMFSAWTARTRFEFSTGWKWCWLEPTDVIDVTSGGRTYTLRITSEDYAGTSQRRAVLDDAEVYSSTATGVPALAVDESVLTTPLTRLELLDIPLLRDVDDGVGFYAAGCGYGSGWAGAQIFKSLDGGATWSSFGNALLHEAAIGDATTALGAFTQNIFDETNSVTVVMTRGTLASATELQVLNGANAAILGDEVIQFRDATLTAESTYKLTGLLRGRLGTEWAASTHAVGDRFVMIDEDTTRVMPGASGEYDLDRDYRGVSFGTILDDAYTETFANTAVARIPYAPVLLGGGRNAAGDLTINWTRRTRLSGGWNNYADVPLGEDSESYEIAIYASGAYGTVKRTITATSQTASYTAAQQTTDFGSPQSTIYVGVFQMSASVGRGYELRGAI